MAGSAFQTNPIGLDELLADCHSGMLQLRDFQRSLGMGRGSHQKLDRVDFAGVSGGGVDGARKCGPVNFKPRLVEGAPEEKKHLAPRSLLLDGQQRMTSLYQVTLREESRRDRYAEKQKGKALVLCR